MLRIFYHHSRCEAFSKIQFSLFTIDLSNQCFNVSIFILSHITKPIDNNNTILLVFCYLVFCSFIVVIIVCYLKRCKRRQKGYDQLHYAHLHVVDLKYWIVLLTTGWDVVAVVVESNEAKTDSHVIWFLILELFSKYDSLRSLYCVAFSTEQQVF